MLRAPPEKEATRPVQMAVASKGLRGTSRKRHDTHKRQAKQPNWSATHPLERWAHRAFESALRRGLVHRQPCESCGADKSEFHHFPDRYHEPLTGRHLCRKCHKAEHKRLRCEVGAK